MVYTHLLTLGMRHKHELNFVDVLTYLRPHLTLIFLIKCFVFSQHSVKVVNASIESLLLYNIISNE